MLRHRVLLAAGLAYIVLTNIIWIAIDTRPPFWDMAYHQSTALRILNAFSAYGIRAVLLVPSLSGGYPLRYPSIVALFYGLFGTSIDVAQAANLPAIALLMFSTYGIARNVLPSMQAATAGVLVIFYPYLLWLSRETMIDYWLCSLVALAIFLLQRTKEFSNRKFCVLFGVVCGLGMLTKATFVLYLAAPALWFAKKNWKNALSAGVPALVIALYWLWPQWRVFQAYLVNTAMFGKVEGDPETFSWQSVVFYARAVEGYTIFLPLFVVFIAGLVCVARRYQATWLPILLWVGGGWLALILIQNKDPRFFAPLLSGVAVISAAAFTRTRLTLALLIPFLLFQHYLVSFGIRALPEAVVVMPGTKGFFDWNWNLYTQSYFGLWGRPAHENWRIEDVLNHVADAKKPSVLGLIPTIPRFDPEAFEFYIALHKYPIEVRRLWSSDVPSLANNDFIVLCENDQGYASLFSNEMPKLTNFVLEHPDRFHLVERFSLPNSDIIRLYKVQRS